MEEWISLTEYMRRNKLGYATVKNMIKKNELETITTECGYIKIKVNSNVVSKEIYDKTLERAVKAETKLKMVEDFIKNLGG